MEDKRYQRAQIKIRNAFMELLQEKNIERITVTDIIHKAGVNRTTFYAHYRDKYDLLYAVEDEFWDPLFADILGQISQEIEIDELVPRFTKKIANYYYANREALKTFIGEKGDPQFWNRFSRRVQRTVSQLPLSKQLKVAPEYAFAFLLGAASNMLMVWTERDFKETPEEFANMVYIMARGIPGSVLKQADDAGKEK